MARNAAVFGTYPVQRTVWPAVDRLQELGYQKADISIVFGVSKRSSKLFIDELKTRAPEGAAAAGALAGAVLGWLAWPAIAAGPVMGALAGGVAGGALSAMAGCLIALATLENAGERQEAPESGDILVSVHCDNSESRSRAKKALKDTGAQKIWPARSPAFR